MWPVISISGSVLIKLKQSLSNKVDVRHTGKRIGYFIGLLTTSKAFKIKLLTSNVLNYKIPSGVPPKIEMSQQKVK